MNAALNLRLTLALAAVSIVGIIGMLLLDGIGDAICLVLAAAPLGVGIFMNWRHR